MIDKHTQSHDRSGGRCVCVFVTTRLYYWELTQLTLSAINARFVVLCVRTNLHTIIAFVLGEWLELCIRVQSCSIIAHSPRAYVRTWDKVLCVGTPLQWLQLFSLLHTSKAELCLNNRQNAQANTIIVLPNRPRHGWCEICYVRVRMCVCVRMYTCVQFAIDGRRMRMLMPG